MTAAQSDQPALELADVTVGFGGFIAVDKLTLSVPRGQFRAIVGPNGAGKTTLINLVQGALRPTTGTIRLLGDDVTSMPVWQRTRRGMARTYQITELFADLSLLDNVKLALYGLSSSRWAMHRRNDRYLDTRTRAMELLDGAGLGGRASVKVATLSHGEQRQLELAMALAHDPELLLLDEPAAGLSPGERQVMLHLLSEVRRTMTVVMIEHNFDLVYALADEVTVLDHGKVIASAEPAQIRADPEVKRIYLT